MDALGSKTNQPGVVDRFLIDNIEFDLPVTGGYAAEGVLQQTAFQSMAGAGKMSTPYRGAGMPHRSELFTFTLPYEIDDTNGLMAHQVELLRATLGPHFFTDWKQRVYVYTFRAGQAFGYLPREDAFARWGGGTPAEISVAGTSVATIVYKPMVAEDDDVPAGEAWIAETAIRHPFSGLYVAPFKLGTVPGAAALLVIRYYPVFRFDVLSVVTTFSATGREDKVLSFTEIN